MLLTVTDLSVQFTTFDGTVTAVNHISFEVAAGEILGIVGESGSGKSVATHSILQLVPSPPGKITSGKIIFGDNKKDLLQMSEEELNKIRGKDIGMIFQEPMTSLNPVYTVENQIVEALKLHLPPMSDSEYRTRAIEALHQVGIPAPESRIKCYPHELSGGMRQRVMIAMSLACEPKLLIADEPTTALDVTIQAQILDVINELKNRTNLAVILITHNLGVVAETADRVAVMYAGKIVESGKTRDIFTNPAHPYTIGLLECIPSYASGHSDSTTENGRLKTIKGMVPDLRSIPPGCAFSNRCPLAGPECQKQEQELHDLGQGHLVACMKKNRI
ncbi:MAG: peptide ABC transporter ATP-binding protein [Bdellovibrionales bacterium RIFOXYD12_FULL_39_22]|nr:MAG: peptide ABC transporter ATP-binding protein [Bdellovibrionales bacterium RIFOXYB1_FULL_39_21]OFZ44196.1 MAG: peptide ABC transporter ATP-binding protein [Bdellovibrionales bacterium RIFOXYC12_FULL_39_17]OFZ46738.1 MAG: peptide ABC transporter ATP-binding protein [Bdellovibrionales bacterium RIFOXYC1_FULL_39_130]OFZ74106.1 MAG: peptide ABC transporter ATP-binding protein [Bdellovibrionales bacterium RIFOXYC2_FULL_39_8]OFZ75985.1 MAG: peptide ABC transporter ATP-binding protein [Bdellovib